MRVGEAFPVQLDGITVGEAQIENIEDDIATIVIPATRVKMKIKSSLDATPITPEVERTTTALVEDPNASAKSELEEDWDSAKHASAAQGGNNWPAGTEYQTYDELPEVTSLKDRDFDSSAID